MNYFSIDFETTDKDAKIAHPVEVALCDDQHTYQQFIKPPIPIPHETSAIHHITDADVENAPDWATTREWLINLVGNEATLIAHNAKYEQGILKDTFEGRNIKWICTYKCALRIWPDAPNHKNETIRYMLGLGDLGRSSIQHPHTAGHDAAVTFQIYLELRKRATLEELYIWSAEPALLPKIPFGKHFGMKWSEVPFEYLSWIMKTADMDADIKWNADREIKRRRANATAGPR